MRLLLGISLVSVLATALAACSASTDAGGSGGGNSGGSSGSGGVVTGGSSGTIGTGGSGGTIGVGGSNTGGSGNFGGECAGVTEQANNSVLPADVIWTIDTSGSMTAETAAVRQNMNNFSFQIANAGVDVRIILIAEQWEPPPFPGLPDEGICIDAPLGSGQCPGDTKLPNFAHIYQTVGSTNSLQLILQTYPTWQQMLRPDSVKIFVVVTDDNSAMAAADFTSQINAIDPAKISPNLWRFYGIFCFTDCPSAASPGTVYQTLVQQTAGVAGDLCLQNFQPVFDQLASGIVGAAKLACAWAIPPAPAGQTFDKNLVNVEFTNGSGQTTTIGKVPTAADCGPQGGWYYDNEVTPKNVILCPASCTAIQSDPNGKIDVKFGCQTVTVPT